MSHVRIMSPRPEITWLSTALIVYSAENVGFYIQKCTVCDFAIAKSAKISDMTFYDSQFEM